MAYDRHTDRLFIMVAAGRLLLLVLFLTITLFFSRTHKDALVVYGYPLIIAGAMIMTVVFAVWYRSGKYKAILRYAQIVFDTIFITVAIMVTGGIDSPFVFLYPVSIIAACLQAGRTGGTVGAILSTISFATIIILLPPPLIPPAELAKTFFLNMAAFSATAYLGRELVRQMSTAEKELIAATRHLKQSKEIQQYLADSIEAGIVVEDRDGRVILWNKAAEKITGTPRTKALSRRLREVMPALAAIGGSPSDKRLEMEFEGPDGERRIIGMSLFELKDAGGGPLGHGIIFQDITEERRQAAHYQRIDRLVALGEMAAGLAHEIRNPLASISGVAQFMKEQKLVESQGEKLLELMERECNRLSRLTENFLQYAKPTRGELDKVNLREEIEGVVELIGKRKGLPQAEVEIEIDASLEASLDRTQFRQVVHNCLLNAFQAVEETGGRIVVRGSMDGDRLELSIEDNGRGIPKELRDRIFDPFFTTRKDGTGLGLSIVHNIVISWGGEISVESEEGRGTAVKISIPLSS